MKTIILDYTKMYNLRSRNRGKRTIDNSSNSDDSLNNEDLCTDTNLPKKRKNHPENIEENPKKIQKKYPISFHPESFNKDLSYSNIADSSDSDSDTSPNINKKDDYTDDKSENEKIINNEKDDINSEEEDINSEEDDINSEEEDINSEEEDINSEEEEYEDDSNEDSWREGLTEDEVNVLEAQIHEITARIKEKSPTIINILKSNLSSVSKERAYFLYNSMKKSNPDMIGYYFLSQELNRLIDTVTTDNPDELDHKFTEIQKAFNQTFPSLDRILSAHLVKNDKIKAINLYESMSSIDFNSEEYFDIYYKIKDILDRQLKSEEEVKKVEAQEEEIRNAAFNYNEDLRKKILNLEADPDVKKQLLDMYYTMVNRGIYDNEAGRIKDKLMWALKLPYNKLVASAQKDKSNAEYCKEVYEYINKNLYGMTKVKERIIQYVNNRIYNSSSRAILALEGKPGVGKTKLAKVIADATGHRFEKISMGGTIDPTLFKGSDPVWIGSMPSIILQILARSKSQKTMIFIDEIDKLGSTERGIEVQHALLHILDPSQSKEFNDMYLSEFSHDISNIWFVVAMNDKNTLYPALVDRLDIMNVPSYTKNEMAEIVKLHTLPQALQDKCIDNESVTITDSACQLMLTRLGNTIEESGMRPVEKVINDIISKLNLLRSLDNQNIIPLSFKLDDFKGFPYTITEKTIIALQEEIPNDKITLNYFI